MKYILLIIIVLFCLNTYAQAKISPEDLKITTGNWEGSITYLDYKTNKPYTMPANLIIKQGKNANILILKNIFPNEPKANNSDKIKIARNGMRLNKKKVISRQEIENGQIKIQTEHKAKDAGRKATIRYTYSIGSDTFTIRKEVRFENSNDWIKRSEYNYLRKK